MTGFNRPATLPTRWPPASVPPTGTTAKPTPGGNRSRSAFAPPTARRRSTSTKLKPSFSPPLATTAHSDACPPKPRRAPPQSGGRVAVLVLLPQCLQRRPHRLQLLLVLR